MISNLPENFFFSAAMTELKIETVWNIERRLRTYWNLSLNQNINTFDNDIDLDVENYIYNKYEEDIKLLKNMKLTSFRTSMQWAKLLDQDGNIDFEIVSWYHKLIDCANENGIDIIIDMYHCDMPKYLIKRGGWQNREVVEAYVNYVKKIVEEFGQKIKYWFTFKEPNIESKQQFVHGIWQPYLKDLKKAINIQYNITLAHCLTVMNFRKLQKENKLIEGAKIGIINCFISSYTKDEPTTDDLKTIKMIDGLHNRWWLDIATCGYLPADVLNAIEKDWQIEIERRPGDEMILAQGKVDWLGFNYYQPTRVEAPEQKFNECGQPCIARPYVWSKRKMNMQYDWEIYPKGIYDLAMKIKYAYPDLIFFICESDDNYLTDNVCDYLEWIDKAVEDGANCLGYHC